MRPWGGGPIKLNKTDSETLEQREEDCRGSEAAYQVQAGRQLLEPAFPEVKWHLKSSMVYGNCFLLGILALIVLAVAYYIPVTALRFMLGLLGIWLGYVTLRHWRQHWQGVLTLTTDGLAYTGWQRPLRFKEITSVDIQGSERMTLTIHLRERQPAIWKYAPIFCPFCSHCNAGAPRISQDSE